MRSARFLFGLAIGIYAEGVTLILLDSRHWFVGLIWWVGMLFEVLGLHFLYEATAERRKVKMAWAQASSIAAWSSLAAQLNQVGPTLVTFGRVAQQAAADFQTAMLRLQKVLGPPPAVVTFGEQMPPPTIYNPVPARLDAPVLGWRSWRLYADDGTLGAFYQPRPWQPGAAHAQCALGWDHAVPSAGCSCGFYATYAPFNGQWPYGLVLGWGKVQFHTLGWRSEFARILAVCTPPPGIEACVNAAGEEVASAQLMAARIAARYSVPIMEPDKMVQFAREWLP